MVEASIILVDLGNVLLGYAPERFARHAAAGSSRSEAEIFGHYERDGGKRGLEKGEVTEAQFFADMAGWLGWPADRAAELPALWVDVLDEVPGAAAAVAQLAEKYALWLLSDTNPPHRRHAWHAYPFLNAFTGVIASYETGILKSEPGAFPRALERLGVAPREVAFLDDLASNVEAARRAGIQAHQFVGWADALRWLGV